MTAIRSSRSCLLLATAFALLASRPAHAAPADDQSYGYVRTVEGTLTVQGATDDEPRSGEVNQPLLTGDRLEVSPRSRAEVVLADRTRLRLGGGSSVVLQSVAFSGDDESRTTRLELLAGSFQMTVGEDVLGDELPRIELRYATLYVQDIGEFAIESDGDSWSQIVVRRGSLEIVTERGSSLLRAGEAANVFGGSRTSTRLSSAPPPGALERWARELDEAPAVRRAGYVDRSLGYAAASLEGHGNWVAIDSSWAWRPNVDIDWRPYWYGRWASTPSGLTWVSDEAWGWLPYHYGTWDFSPGIGWVWYPGRTYSPAWVYWYWGSEWTGWCPVGYYARHHGRGHSERGLSFGLHGIIGGSLDLYAHWNFGPSRHLFDRNRGGDYHRGGRELAQEIGGHELPKGVLTTGTRGLDPRRLRDGSDPLAMLDRRDLPAGRRLDKLPDLTALLAQRPDPALGGPRRTFADEPEIAGEDRGGGRHQRIEYKPAEPIEGRHERTVRGRPAGRPASNDSPNVELGSSPGDSEESAVALPTAPDPGRQNWRRQTASSWPSEAEKARDRFPGESTDERAAGSFSPRSRRRPVPSNDANLDGKTQGSSSTDGTSGVPAWSGARPRDERSWRYQPDMDSPSAAADPREERPPVRRVIDGFRRSSPSDAAAGDGAPRWAERSPRGRPTSAQESVAADPPKPEPAADGGASGGDGPKRGEHRGGRRGSPDRH